MTPLNVLIVDDEPLAVRRLEIAIDQFEDVRHVGSALNRPQALELIERHAPDVLLLDVRLRDGTGFDLLQELPPERAPVVIFVTAYDHYAVRAFEVSATDYLPKPISQTRLSEALGKARQTIATKDLEARLTELRELLGRVDATKQPPTEARFETEFWIRRRAGELLRVPAEAIDYVISEEDYVRLHVGDRSYLMRESLNRLQQRLDPSQFVRVHRSYLVRWSAIREIRNAAGRPPELVLHSERRISCGRIYAKALRKALAERR